MAERWLGTSSSHVDFTDESKYRPLRETEGGTPQFEETWRRIRNTGLINLGQFKKSMQPFIFDIEVLGGSSWSTVLTLIAAIQTQLDAAAVYSMAGTGSQILYHEKSGDQSSASEWNVKYGKLWEIRSQRLVVNCFTRVHLELVCEAGAVA